MSKEQLLVIWKESFGSDAPVHLRKELMVPILAYRIQEREYGGLSLAARRQLKELAKTSSARSSVRSEGRSAVETGSRLMRSWRGEIHEVFVIEDGFECRGKQYGSLSKIAREITGTRWSGPLFFGTRKGLK
jgi:hypothetical protein